MAGSDGADRAEGGRYDSRRLMRSKFGLGNLEAEAEASSTKWVHVPARETLRIVMLSDRACKYRGHWDEGRMRMCTGDGCALCAMRRGHQDRYAFSVYVPVTQSRALLEVGPSTVIMMEEAMMEVGELRGLVYDLSHEGKVKNGLVLAKFVSVWAYRATLPKAEDPREQLDRQRQAESDRWARRLVPGSVPGGSAGERLGGNGVSPVVAVGTSQPSGGRSPECADARSSSEL